MCLQVGPTYVWHLVRLYVQSQLVSQSQATSIAGPWTHPVDLLEEQNQAAAGTLTRHLRASGWQGPPQIDLSS